MQICNKISKSSIFVLMLLTCSSLLFAESIEMPDMPQMPTLSDFPELSIPMIDDSFYRPTLPTQNLPPAKKKEENANSGALSDVVLSDATTSDDLISSFFINNSTLTANDISSLYDSGLFSDVSSINGNTTNLLLNQILTSLDELKSEQKKVSVERKEELQNTQTDSQTFKKREPSILRFSINGYNISDSLSTVFFSETEADGTFLLTADRKYFANQKPRTETFYILFRAVKSNGSIITYEVEPSIVQDYENKNSFVYRMTNCNNLKAEKTGNLVALHGSGDVNVDMLLNIDK